MKIISLWEDSKCAPSEWIHKTIYEFDEFLDSDWKGKPQQHNINQYNTIQTNTAQYKPIQHNTNQYNTIQTNPTQYKRTQLIISD